MKNEKCIVFVGRLPYQKAPFLFLDILEPLPEYTATIVGDGELQDKVKTEIKRRGLTRVQTLGTLPHSETLQILSSLSTVVLTSRWEGWPILLLEAMWTAVPVVAPNVGSLNEIIEDGKSGLLVGARSAPVFAETIIRLNDDLGLRERFIEEARSGVQPLFSEERMLSN